MFFHYNKLFWEESKGKKNAVLIFSEPNREHFSPDIVLLAFDENLPHQEFTDSGLPGLV